jgi:hypothetical protein
MGNKMQSGCKSVKSTESRENAGQMGDEGVIGGMQLGAKGASIEDCISEYIKRKSVAKAAAIIGVREDTLRKRLAAEARSRGLSDIRMFHGGSRSVVVGVTKSYLMELIKKQEYRCELSGMEITPDNATLDHKVPISKGGEHVEGNLAWVHAEINRMKGQLPLDEFVSLCRKVAQYTR